MAYRDQGPCPVKPVFYILNIDTQDRQDKQDEKLLHSLQPINCNPLIIKDLIWITRLQFPHYIPLFEMESTGPFRMLADELFGQAVMAWTRTRLEVPAITGDPSVLLATPPPDGGWTPRLGRTVTGGQVSRGSTLNPRLSSGVPRCPCCR